MVRIVGREDLCFSLNTVAIGWASVRSLNSAESSWEQFKAAIREKYPDYTSAQALGQVAGILWRFVREIQPGDWIVVPTWTGLNLAEVSAPILYDETLIESDSAWRFPVKWIRRDIPRDTASGLLRARCSSRQTCVEATDFLEELERLSRAQGKPALEIALLNSGARDAIGKVLDEHLTADDLEALIAKLLAKGGTAQVDRPPKNYQGKRGDVDVIARYSFPKFAVGYQVKKHAEKSLTDEFAVQQMIEAMSDEQLAIDIGCVVTTANEFTPAAISLASRSAGAQIRLMVRDDLVQWVLSSGVSSLR
jgi:predicted Mrr-cat superfamily restriction endonuclease